MRSASGVVSKATLQNPLGTLHRLSFDAANALSAQLISANLRDRLVTRGHLCQGWRSLTAMVIEVRR